MSSEAVVGRARVGEQKSDRAADRPTSRPTNQQTERGRTRGSEWETVGELRGARQRGAGSYNWVDQWFFEYAGE